MLGFHIFVKFFVLKNPLILALKYKVKKFVISIVNAKINLLKKDLLLYLSAEIEKSDSKQNAIYSEIKDLRSSSSLYQFEMLKLTKSLSNPTYVDCWEILKNRNVGLYHPPLELNFQDKNPNLNYFAGGLNCLLSKRPIVNISGISCLDYVDCVAVWGHAAHETYLDIISNCLLKNKKVFFLEDGFIFNIISYVKSKKGNYEPHITMSCSFTVDNITAHFDGSLPSNLERFLNSDFKMSTLDLERAQRLIKSIVKNKITKYNYQSTDLYPLGGSHRKKVLVVGQAYNDYSVHKSAASLLTFKSMIYDAMTENPDSDVILKVHPDMLEDSSRGGAPGKGYLEQCYVHNERVYLLKDDVNPFVILEMSHF